LCNTRASAVRLWLFLTARFWKTKLIGKVIKILKL
jgi:hypothetical protein